VVDVPSTVHGGHLTQPPLRSLPLAGIPGALRYRLRLARELSRQVDALLDAGGVVTVQQHITSSRPDGAPQTPNLRDDGETLRRIFTRLRERTVWHATCGEIARYFDARSAAKVSALSGSAFEVRFGDGRVRSTPLSLVVNGAPLPDEVTLRSKSGERRVGVARRSGPFTAVLQPTPLEAGVYEIVRHAAGSPV
jgi:hypothetical protein